MHDDLLSYGIWSCELEHEHELHVLPANIWSDTAMWPGELAGDAISA